VDTQAGNDGAHTNHFVVSDRWGNVVSYTNTIEQLGGSGIVVPGRGFLLNNELTDFNFAPTQGTAPDPNLPAPGKRPRSSMSPTILLNHGLTSGVVAAILMPILYPVVKARGLYWKDRYLPSGQKEAPAAVPSAHPI